MNKRGLAHTYVLASPKGPPLPRSGAYTSRGVVTKYEVNSSHLLSPTTVPVNTMPLIVKHYILSIAISISFKAGLVQSNGLHRQLFPIPAIPEPFVVCLRQAARFDNLLRGLFFLKSNGVFYIHGNNP